MTIKGPQLHEGQQRAVELLLSNSKYICCVAPRQTGKSFLAMQAILYWAINEPGAVIFFCSPTYSQAKKVMEELHNAIGESGIVKAYNRSDFCIKFKTGSVIYFKSTERADNLRGNSGTHLVIDEASYHAEGIWDSVLKPIMLVKGRKCLFISTPRGSNNWFKRMYDRGMDAEQEDYVSCRMHYSENPHLDLKELEEARRTLPEHIFKAEYEGSFTDSGQGVFDMEKVITFETYPRANGKIYCGIDLGRVDSTVATFMNADGTIVHIYRNQLQDWSTMVSEMMALIKKYNATVLVEVNSIGDVIGEQIKKQHQDTHFFVTSNKSKNDIIEGLAVDLHTGQVQIPSRELFEPLFFELDIFEYNYSVKTRTIRYAAPASFHDDTVMSLAITNHCRKTKKSLGSYTYMASR